VVAIPVSIRPPLASALLALTLATPAWAQPSAGAFPPASDIPTLATWLPANTSLPLTTVVSIGGGRVIAVIDSKPKPGSDLQGVITIRTEIIGRTEAEQAKALSETQDIDIDCENLRAKAGPMKQFSGRGLTGSSRTTPGWNSWSSAPPSTTLGRMIRAACDPSFRGTFVEAGMAAEPLRPMAPAAPAVVASAAPKPTAASPKWQVGPAPAKTAKAAAKPPAVAPVDAAKAILAPAEEPPAQKKPAPAAKPAKAAAAKAEPEAAPTAELGRHLVQIGASRDRDQAAATLAAYRKKFPDRMKGRPAVVEETVVADQTFFRILLGGFDTQSDSDAFCEMHKTTGGDCMLRER
jgi:sporulation related protein/surface-adhesin protein E